MKRLSILLTFTVLGLAAQTVTYNPASSIKLEQVIGDCDYQVQAQKGICQATASQTAARFNVLGNGFGYTFEDNGKLIYLSGDTISKDPKTVNYHAKDPVAFSTTTDGEAPFVINYFQNSDGLPLFIEASGLATGADDIGNSGISIAGGVYIVYNTGADESLDDPHQNAFSVLVRFDEGAKTFTAGRTISRLPGGHFLFTALHASGTDVYMWGLGNYRASDMFLSKTPASTFATGAGTQYFTGIVNGQPTWSTTEAAALPIIRDNPLNDPNYKPTIGNVSVAYSSDLNLWLLLYDGGRQTQKTKGVYFSYAEQPWGPWSTPQLIFNEQRDKAYGTFVHDPNIVPDPPGDGLNGPVIGANDPYTTPGGIFAPLIVERFTRVSGNILKIYYVLSTWNPYTVVKVRSDFTIARAPTLTADSLANGATYLPGGLVPGSWAQVKGTGLSGVSRIWSGADFAGLGNSLPTTLSGVQVKVNNLPAAVYFIDPGQVSFQVPGGVTGSASVQVINNGVASNTITASASTSAPGIFPIIVNGASYPAGVFPDGKYVGDPSAGAAFRKAKPGDVIQLFATGVLPTPAGVLPVVQGLNGVTVTVGNVVVPADYAGLVAVGEFQVNFTVPQQYATRAEGAYPISIQFNGASSPQLVLPIQH